MLSTMSRADRVRDRKAMYICHGAENFAVTVTCSFCYSQIYYLPEVKKELFVDYLTLDSKKRPSICKCEKKLAVLWSPAL